MNERQHIPDKRTLAVVGCATALLVAGCGSDNEGKQLPSSSVSALENQLDSIQSRVRAGACTDVTGGNDSNSQAVQTQIDNLPSDVDKDVRDSLEESFQNLFQLVKDNCETKTETETTPTETTPAPAPAPPPPAPPQTETTPTETTTKPEKPKKPKKPNDNQGSGGNPGNGNSGGSGGSEGSGGQAAPGAG
jgi:hypothetical protein